MAKNLHRPSDLEIAGTWFLHWAVRYRWVGATAVQLTDMHSAVLATLSGNVLEGHELANGLNAVGEHYYPSGYAAEWMASHPMRDRSASET